MTYLIYPIGSVQTQDTDVGMVRNEPRKAQRGDLVGDGWRGLTGQTTVLKWKCGETGGSVIKVEPGRDFAETAALADKA